MAAFRDLTNSKFGRWTVLQKGPQTTSGLLWVCRCDCGTQREVIGDTLKKGLSRSCGCSGKDWCRSHGMEGSPTYESWSHMKYRCDNKNAKNYDRYGGRGIKYDERWRSFEGFFKDMGVRPHNATLDRINNDGDYGPNNCRWATQAVQLSNRSVTKFIEYNGERRPLSEWAQLLGIKRKTLTERLRKGWPPEKALDPSLQSCWTGHNARTRKAP